MIGGANLMTMELERFNDKDILRHGLAIQLTFRKQNFRPNGMAAARHLIEKD